jgi:hypothetical protein
LAAGFWDKGMELAEQQIEEKMRLGGMYPSIFGNDKIERKVKAKFLAEGKKPGDIWTIHWDYDLAKAVGEWAEPPVRSFYEKSGLI